MNGEIKQYSLRLHLLSLISIPILLAGCVIGGFVIYSAYHEISEVYDAQLAHAAKVLLQLTEHEVDEHESYQIELGAERPDIKHRYEKNTSFRIWEGDHMVTESVSAEAFADVHPPPGFSNQEIKGELWRFFVYVDDQTALTIEVAERQEIRTELILQILSSFFAPALIFVPLILLFVWFGTTKSLKPLLRISEAVDRRDADDLTPISAGRVPREVMPLMRALNRLLLRMDVGLRREREFTDNAAHELRTPLAAMKTQTQVLMKKAGDMPEYKEGLNDLHASIDRASHMVCQLLAFARMQSRDMEFDKFDLSALVGEILKEVSPLSVAKNQTCEADIAEHVMVWGNSDALAIMIRNLVENAIKFTPEGGRIAIGLDSDATLHVSDTGPGIPDQEKEKVLERFSRGSKVRQQGSGLGLAMVKWVSDLHHARLQLSDNKPKGLTVSVKLEPVT